MATLLLLLVFPAFACPPQPNGGCYAGSYIGGRYSISSQQCGEDLYKDWCAVTFQPAGSVANFGCANTFQTSLGLPKCGLGIDRSGCNTVQTSAGSCLLCCCQGPQCNDPRNFLNQAQLQFGYNFAPDTSYPLPNVSRSIFSPFLCLILINILI